MLCSAYMYRVLFIKQMRATNIHHNETSLVLFDGSNSCIHFESIRHLFACIINYS